MRRSFGLRLTGNSLDGKGEENVGHIFPAFPVPSIIFRPPPQEVLHWEPWPSTHNSPGSSKAPGRVSLPGDASVAWVLVSVHLEEAGVQPRPERWMPERRLSHSCFGLPKSGGSCGSLAPLGLQWVPAEMSGGVRVPGSSRIRKPASLSFAETFAFLE